MKIPIFDFDKIKSWIFIINWFMSWNDINNIYDNKTNKSIKIGAMQQNKIFSKIMNRNKNFHYISLIAHVYSWPLSKWIDTIYRIEILDDDKKIIDSINIHKEWVPKLIREEFDKEFRRENIIEVIEDKKNN